MHKESDIPFPNAGFEDGMAGWTVEVARGGDIRIVDVAFSDSRRALQIKATSERDGARVDGPLVPCKGIELLELYGSVRSVRGRSLGLWGYHIDADRNVLPGEFWTCLEAEDGVWHRHGLLGVITPHPRAAFIQITLIAYPKGEEVVECYVDDFRLVKPAMRIPPLPSRYKLRPGDRLTAADVRGPDGLVYPDWTRAGVQGGIPDLPVALRLADLGATPGTDISPLLEAACRQAGAKGGGAVLLGEGTYHLDRPVTIQDSRVVIRGAGRDKTFILFRYSKVRADAPPPERDIGSVLTFRGLLETREYPLATDGRRGDTTLTLIPGHDLRPGDKVVLRAPDTPRWEAEVNHRAVPPVDPTHAYHMWGRRTNQYAVAAVAGDRITLSQPLRIDYPVADSSHLRRVRPVEYCGVEDLSIRHECRMEFHTITTQQAWNCWVRRIDAIDCGRSGVHFQAAKWCELRDCTFTGFDPAVHKPHVNWGGYAGFTQACDCLMDNTVWHRFRHGPCVQFGAQGNVIRNSAFHGSEAQWHAGWSTENLFENCLIEAGGPYGSYGFGAFATGSYDGGHGPNGPRNVMYNCDVRSTRDGVLLNGVNEHWLFLYNRFVAANGAGFTALCGAFDHVIRHNLFVVENPGCPLLHLQTSDCTGVELLDNTLVGGNGNLYEGAPTLASSDGNRVLPLSTSLPVRPRADPPSIFAWQRTAASRLS